MILVSVIAYTGLACLGILNKIMRNVITAVPPNINKPIHKIISVNANITPANRQAAGTMLAYNSSLDNLRYLVGEYFHNIGSSNNVSSNS